MDVYSQIASRIIKEQQNIIGPLAIREANKVAGLRVASVDDITMEGDYKQILQNLVIQYARLFGNASIEICKEAAEPFLNDLPQNELPEVFK